MTEPPAASFRPIIENGRTNSDGGVEAFDPVKHLAYEPPSSIISMADIGYPANAGVSPVAVSEPFQLFSKDAIEQMRAEFLDPEVMAKHKVASNIAACQLRGYASK